MNKDSEEIFTPKSFAIIGAGPSGCVLASFLAKSGYQVALCDLINDLINPAMNRGIIIDGYCKIKQTVNNIYTEIENIKDISPDVIFIATKATSSISVAKKINNIRSENTYVVSWQNGIDTEIELSKKIPKKYILRAVVNYGCSLIAPAHVNISFFHPPNYLQELNPLSNKKAKIIADILTNCGLTTKYINNIKSMVWRKAILNAAMNPVCAVTGLTMFEAMREKWIYNIVDSLLKECILIAQKNEIEIEENFYKHAIDYMSNAGNHKPSMLMDIENNKMTEIDYINGKFEEYGLYAGIETPFNTVFRSLVKGKEFKIKQKSI